MKVSKTVGGNWARANEIVSGTKIKLTTEATVQTSEEYGDSLIAKAKIQGALDEVNIRINKPSKNALIDAFGDDTTNWVGKVLTAQTEKSVVAGKRVTILYLVPEGFTLGEDAGGYVVIVRNGAPTQGTDTAPITPDDIPF